MSGWGERDRPTARYNSGGPGRPPGAGPSSGAPVHVSKRTVPGALPRTSSSPVFGAPPSKIDPRQSTLDRALPVHDVPPTPRRRRDLAPLQLAPPRPGERARAAGLRAAAERPPRRPPVDPGAGGRVAVVPQRLRGRGEPVRDVHPRQQRGDRPGRTSGQSAVGAGGRGAAEQERAARLQLRGPGLPPRRPPPRRPPGSVGGAGAGAATTSSSSATPSTSSPASCGGSTASSTARPWTSSGRPSACGRRTRRSF